MNRKLIATSLAAATLTGVMALPAAAQTIINSTNVDEIVNLARGYGSATLNSTSANNPIIDGRINGLAYSLIFLNCDDAGANCRDIRFFTSYSGDGVDFEDMNRWNYEKRFAKSYLTPESEVILEWDVDLEFGVTWETMDATFAIWQEYAELFNTYMAEVSAEVPEEGDA